MKKTFVYILFTLVVVSCSTSGGTFRMKGKFKNFSQGELLVYSLQGKGKIDTIRLVDRRFNYEVPLEDTLVLSVVFPNYSEIPVIAIPGKTVTIQGDASHLREVQVEGTDDNELLTAFRLKVNEAMPPEAEQLAEAFIAENPSSPACLYVLNKYFLLKSNADYGRAFKLLEKMQQASPHNRFVSRLHNEVSRLSKSQKGDRLPSFKAVTTGGTTVTNANLKGDVNVISLWACWNYESQSVQRQLLRLKKKYGQRLQLLSISIDGNPAECKQIATRDSLSWPLVCSGQMWETPLVSQLGFSSVPDVLIADANGRIVMRHFPGKSLYDDIEKRLQTTH